MANPPTGGVTYNDMAETVAEFLGYGRDPANWGTVLHTETMGAGATLKYTQSTNSTQIVLTSAGTFASTDVNKHLVFRGGGSYVVDTFTDNKTVTVIGDATNETSGTLDVVDLTTKLHEIDSIVQESYQHVLQEHRWKFLEPTATLVGWPSYTVTAGTTVDASADDTADDFTVLTPSGTTKPVFYDSVVGKKIIVTGASTTTGYQISKFNSDGTIDILDANDEVDGLGSGLTFSLAADGNYRLPENFGYMMGDITFDSDQSVYQVPRVSETLILNKRMNYSTTGTPRLVAIRPLATAGPNPQRWEAMFWPTPDAVYNMSYRYSVVPDRLDKRNNPYPLGSIVLGVLYLQACRMVSEFRRDKERGVQLARYRDMLPNMIDRDRQSEPEYLGYNGNFEDNREDRVPLLRNTGTVYNGVKL